MEDITGLPLKAVVTKLVDEMSQQGGWCGETHIQKTAYFLQGLLGVPLGYDFVIYKHGPYSFDLHDDLAIMKANRFLKSEAQYPYGPSFRKGDLGQVVTDRFPKTLGKFDRQIKFVAKKIGNKDKGVVELERLGTALFVTKTMNIDGVGSRASEMVRLKPHISIADARQAVESVDELIRRASEKGLTPQD